MNRSQMDPAPTVTVISVAGVDPSGRAGLLSDVLTGAALGITVVAVGTAWTQQPTGGPGAPPPTGRASIEPRDPAAVGAALRSALAEHPHAGVKVGMVANAAVATAIVGALESAGFAGPLVVDPVLAASSGVPLWDGPLAGLLPLLRRTTLVTPNAGELAALAGIRVASLDQAVTAAQALRAQGVVAVLIKGGHLDEAAALVTDVLVGPAGQERRFSRPRVPGPSPRGTGCALSTALAAQLAGGAALADAVDVATRWLAARIAATVATGPPRHLAT